MNPAMRDTSEEENVGKSTCRFVGENREVRYTYERR